MRLKKQFEDKLKAPNDSILPLKLLKNDLQRQPKPTSKPGVTLVPTVDTIDIFFFSFTNSKEIVKHASNVMHLNFSWIILTILCRACLESKKF